MSQREIMIVAGEASGDLHAANLVDAYRKLDPDAHFFGMGSSELAQTGVELLHDSRDIAVIGLVEVLKHYPQIKKVLKQLQDAVVTRKPELIILVDYVEFNLKLAKTAKEAGVKVLFYVSPQVWAWRPKRVKKIGERIDHMAVLFPFEVKFYEKHAIPVTYVGNPLLDHAKPSMSRELARESFGLAQQHPVLALLPGSRGGEIKRLLPLFLQTAVEVQKHLPAAQFILPIANTVKNATIQEHLAQFPDLNVTTVNGQSYDVVNAADAVISASGTATLETALIGTPLIITYRVAPLSYFILSRLITVPHIGLANIVAEQEVAKEYIQDAAQAPAMATELVKLLNDKTYNQEKRHALEIVTQKMGKSGGSENVAKLAFEMVQTSIMATSSQEAFD